MCHFCHTLRNNTNSPNHTKFECRSTRNPWSRNFDPRNYNDPATLYALSRPPPDGAQPVPAARRSSYAPQPARPAAAVMPMAHHHFAALAPRQIATVMPMAPPRQPIIVPIMLSNGNIVRIPLYRF